MNWLKKKSREDIIQYLADRSEILAESREGKGSHIGNYIVSEVAEGNVSIISTYVSEELGRRGYIVWGL